MPEPLRGIALDIDDTLCHTFEHWLDALHSSFGALHSKEEIAAAGYRVLEEYPHWKDPEGARRWIMEARESDPLHEEFPLIENANHLVERIHEVIPIAAYITARPERVRNGTSKWLKRHGFIDAPLIMRPETVGHGQGSAWKASLLHELYPGVQAIVDDRPSLIRHLPEGYQGVVFLYGQKRTDARDDIRVIECATWEEVYAQIKTIFS